jgi:hypothetical protein
MKQSHPLNNADEARQEVSAIAEPLHGPAQRSSKELTHYLKL